MQQVFSMENLVFELSKYMEPNSGFNRISKIFYEVENSELLWQYYLDRDFKDTPLEKQHSFTPIYLHKNKYKQTYKFYKDLTILSLWYNRHEYVNYRIIESLERVKNMEIIFSSMRDIFLIKQMRYIPRIKILDVRKGSVLIDAKNLNVRSIVFRECKLDEEFLSKARFHKLKSFNATDCKLKKFDFGQYYNLDSLTSLTIVHNLLEKIPKNIEKLSNLKNLDLSNNKIDKISKRLFVCDQISSINLSYNNISVIPKEMGKLSKLTRLFISGNKISEIGENLDKTKLLYIDCKNNFINNIHPDFYKIKLEFLDISTNNLSSFIKCEIPSLQNLIISENHIETIPESIEKLQRLNILHASHCKIKKIPQNLKKCVKLTILYLDYNEIEEFPFHILREDIYDIDLSCNKIRDMRMKNFTEKETNLVKEYFETGKLLLLDNPIEKTHKYFEDYVF